MLFLVFFFLGAGVWVFAVYDTLVTQETAFAFNGSYILLQHCHHQYLLPTGALDVSFYSTPLLLGENTAPYFGFDLATKPFSSGLSQNDAMFTTAGLRGESSTCR